MLVSQGHVMSDRETLDAGQPWSHEVPTYCGVTREQYPDPRPCPAPMPDVFEPTDGLCHLGHPYNCRRYLTDMGIDWRATS